MTFTPPFSAQEPLQVLPCGYQQPLDVDLPQPPQSKAAQPMPLFGFTKERFNPDRAFAQRLFVDLGLAIGGGAVKCKSSELLGHLGGDGRVCHEYGEYRFA